MNTDLIPDTLRKRQDSATGFDRIMLPIYRGWYRVDASIFNRRSSVPPMKRQFIYALIMLIAQTGITFTGSLVRITGSGLGCDTWPQCHPGSFVPVSGSAPWIHQLIEFGNRMLTFVVALACVLAFTSVLRAARRTQILHLAFFQGIGVILQAVIGGITVHLDLAWWMVMAHFLPSMILVFFAAKLVIRVTEPDDGTKTNLMAKPLRIAMDLSVLALAINLVTGTMTTSAGPHAGDAAILPEHRLQIPLFEMAQVHAHFMYLYLGLTASLIAGLFATKTTRQVRRTAWWVVAAIIVQGGIGIMQYQLGVPRWTVPLHVIGTGIVTALAGLFWAQKFRWTGGSAEETGSVEGDAARAE
ncbi:heme A synthase [Corynebacterium sp. 320]|uniref:COX15/CtaA family protein n=1 Tax=Corynebacterium TaxID=1716 RepID=UPI00351A742F